MYMCASWNVCFHRQHVILQSHTVAVGYALGAARILSHVIQTGSDGLDAAIKQLRDPGRPHPFPTDYPMSLDIERAKNATGKPHPQAVIEFGSACGKFMGKM